MNDWFDQIENSKKLESSKLGYAFKSDKWAT